MEVNLRFGVHRKHWRLQRLRTSRESDAYLPCIRFNHSSGDLDQRPELPSSGNKSRPRQALDRAHGCRARISSSNQFICSVRLSSLPPPWYYSTAIPHQARFSGPGCRSSELSLIRRASRLPYGEDPLGAYCICVGKPASARTWNSVALRHIALRRTRSPRPHGRMVPDA